LPASQNFTLISLILAEFRGPGVHHNFEDSDSGYEMDAENKGKSFGVGGYRGRIIFLGDGTEVLTDSDDTEMFDNADEDKDLESQVYKGSSSATSDSKDAKTETKTESLSSETKTEAAQPQTKSDDKTPVADKKQESVPQEAKKD
jgi:protein phosphatase PTC2/3